MTRDQLIEEISRRRTQRRVYDAENCTSIFEEIYQLQRYSVKGIEEMTDEELAAVWTDEQEREAEESAPDGDLYDGPDEAQE